MERPALHDRLAAALKRVREGAGLSQRELAAKLGTNQTRISFIESGDQLVRVIDLFEWCSATGTDPLEVLKIATDL